MELSKEQIDQLFKFTEKKYVRWYDVQLEIVDHLATKIEEMMTNDKTLSFDYALQQVYAGFGIFGFAKVVQQKHNALEEAARRIWWKAVAEYFTWPKIAFTICIFLVIAEISKYLDPVLLQLILFAGYIFSEIPASRRSFKLAKANKKLLLVQTGSVHTSFFMFFYQTTIFSRSDVISPWAFASWSLAGILFNVAYYKLYNSVVETAREQYPEVFVEV